MVVVNLVVTSVNDLIPVPSRVMCWVSIWRRPVLSTVVMVCLAWTWRGQAQWLWVSIRTVIHRHAIRPHPATYGNLGRDQGTPEATWGLLQARGPVGMPDPIFWAGAHSIGASNGVDMQAFPNPAYRARGPMCPHSMESVSLDASVSPHDSTREASEAAMGGGTEHTPAAPVGYPLDINPPL